VTGKIGKALEVLALVICLCIIPFADWLMDKGFWWMALAVGADCLIMCIGEGLQKKGGTWK
jgi:hypothetical protein